MTLFLSNRDGNGKTSEEGHYKFPVNAFVGNVLNAADLVVSQQSPVALGVTIAAGQYRIPDVSGNYAYTGWNDSPLNVSISTADPSNPRLSAIVLYVDKAAPTSASPPNNPGIVKAMSVNGTPAASPVIPSNAVIQAAVGASNPYIILATARVNAAGTTVPNAQITDLRTMVTLAANLIGASSIQDGALTTAKFPNNAVTSPKLANQAVTKGKIMLSYFTIAGNNGSSRQTFPAANTTYTIAGSSFSYTSGDTAELLDISHQGLYTFTAGGSQVWIGVNGVQAGKSNYIDATVWTTRNTRAFYEIPANTTVTIASFARTAGTAGGTVCNATSDQSGTPHFGIQTTLIAWGRA